MPAVTCHLPHQHLFLCPSAGASAAPALPSFPLSPFYPAPASPSPAHPMVLVGSDRGELGLWEDEGLEVLRGGGVLAGRVDVDDVKPRLVTVHRVQDHLDNRVRKVGNDDALNVAESSWVFEELRKTVVALTENQDGHQPQMILLMSTLQYHIFCEVD